MITKVNSFLGELFNNPKYNGDISQKEDFNHQKVKTPLGDVIVVHASPSFRGGQSTQYWTWSVDFSSWNNLRDFLERRGHHINTSTHINILKGLTKKILEKG